MTPQETSQPGSHLLDGAVRVLLAEALLPVTGLVTAAFLTRRLGPADYGLLTLTATVVAWIEWTIASVFARPAIKFISEAEDWRPVGAMLLRMYLGVSCAAGMLLWWLAGPIATLFDEPGFRPYLQLFAVDIPLFGLAQVHRSILIGQRRYRERSYISASRWISRLLLIILLVELGLSVSGAILGMVGASAVELLVGRRYVRPSLKSASSRTARQTWSYAAPLLLSMLGVGLYNHLDLIALKALGGSTAQAGMLGAARNLAFVPVLLAGALTPLLQATIGRLHHAGERDRARAMGRQALRVVMGLAPFVAVSLGAAAEIVTWIFGPLFSTAAPLLAVLMVGAPALSVISVVTSILIAEGRLREIVSLTSALAPLALIGHWVFIPRFGALGAAFVSMSVAWLVAAAALGVVHRLGRLLPPAATFWRSVVISTGVYALAAGCPAVVSLVPLKLALLGLLVPLSFYVLGEFSAGELALIRSLARRAAPERGRPDG